MRTSAAACFSTTALLFAACIAPAFAVPSRTVHSFAQSNQQQRLWKLLKDQADGKRPAPMTHVAMKLAVSQFMTRPNSKLNIRPDMKRLRIWATDFSHSFIIGTSARGKKAVASINGANTGCYFPTGVKVDHATNLWVSCEASPAPGLSGGVQMYANGNLTGTYAEGCPMPSGCSGWYSYGLDVATDAAGNVFAPLATYSFNYDDSQQNGSGFEWWAPQSSSPTLIALPYGNPVNSVYYADADSAGNLWFDYSGCIGSQCGFGLAEIQTPTTTPTFVPILPPGSIEYPGGVYVSNHGTVLNVADQGALTVQQYSIPTMALGIKLGPTPLNNVGFSAPVAGGFSKGDVRAVYGDAFNWLDVGNVSTNTWTIASYLGVTTAGGAAYVPSDK